MKRIQHALLFSILFMTTNITYAQGNEIFIKAGLLYDSEQNALLKDKVIHVIGNRIAAIGNTSIIPPGAVVEDLGEYTVMPGLIDAHTHVLFSQEPSDDFAEHSVSTLTLQSDALRVLRASKRARSYLDVGFTSIKDLGNSGHYLDVALRDAINEGSIEGPRVFASGPILSANGGQLYGVIPSQQDLVNLEYRIIKGAEDARIAVREHVNQGVDIIKICADNLPNRTRLSVEEMKAVVEEAHTYGLKVTAHAIMNQSTWDAVQAGVDGIEHGFYLADSTLQLMAEKEVYLVPTENSRHYMDTFYKLAGTDSADLNWLDSYFTNMEHRLKRARQKGVIIVAGSDNYNEMGVSPGRCSLDMFRAYMEMGMEPLNILQSATYLSALQLNKEKEIGVLKAGALADIIAVKGNVKADFLKTLEQVLFVMKDGKIFVREAD